MNLSSLIGQINQTYTETGMTEGNAALEQSLRNGMETIMSKGQGQTVAGEVLKLLGEEVLLSIGKNQVLKAQVDGGMMPQPGQLLTFQIKNNSGNKILLSPLFENTSSDPNVLKALREAGLPQNGNMAGMVRAMMQEGLPIDRQSLYQMNRLMGANPQTPVETLSRMQKLQIPVTAENIQQFEHYQNLEHQLLSSITDLTEGFGQSIGQMLGTQDPEKGISFFENILKIFSGQENAGGEEISGFTDGDDQTVVQQNGEKSENQTVQENGKELRETLSEGELQNLSRSYRQAGAPASLVKEILTGNITGKQLFEQTQGLLTQEQLPEKEKLLSLMEGREFKQILKGELKGRFLLEPEEVGQEHSVKRLYERMNTQLRQLSRALSEAGAEGTPLAKTVSNLSGNLEFMHQLNQMFTYIQLPLKMQNQNANGELFVYTNKKSLAKKDGAVSALLHLDMENLGSVDVHVTLREEKVSTKFYLKDDAALDLVEAHIDMLNERLQKRGYLFQAEFLQSPDEKNVVTEILSKDSGVKVLSGRSFDARA